MVAGLRGSDYEERCAELGLETLEERRQSQDMALVHKMMNNGQGARMFEFARNDDNGVRTRRAAATHGLVVQFARTDIRKYSFAVRVVEPWNRLPDTLKKAASKEAFKREWKLLRKETLQETRTGSVKRRHERKVKVTTESEEWTLF